MSDNRIPARRFGTRIDAGKRVQVYLRSTQTEGVHGVYRLTIRPGEFLTWTGELAFVPTGIDATQVAADPFGVGTVVATMEAHNVTALRAVLSAQADLHEEGIL